MTALRFFPVVLLASLLALAGCAHHALRPVSVAGTANDNSFMDLDASWRLRILVPLVSSGGVPPATDSVREEGGSIVITTRNLAGYELFFYDAEARSRGKVQLRFAFAEITKDGQTVPDPSEPALPFPLPPKPAHIRLMYLIRSSRSDHNMAIAAAKDMKSLEAFTAAFKVNSRVCDSVGNVFCSWVPVGVAVRPEPAGG